ncbi:hypothetical protein [Desulfogranum marinum]|uniref:hypothetical protein n=1 Tax=Desulfogranum marinum TaxID=453220 RepID=UPI0029C82A0B|nr:hypothetical protein [Desulfogranum marinum]
MNSTRKTESAETKSSAPFGWRLQAGVVLFGLSLAVPVVGVPVVGFLHLDGTLTATLSGGLLAAGELLGLAAVAVMGKPGYIYLKGKAAALLKRHGSLQHVSRFRYRIGLVLFCLPLIFGWVSVYIPRFLPGFQQNPLPYAMAGDLMFITSFFVLGGDFWDKLQSLFRHKVNGT